MYLAVSPKGQRFHGVKENKVNTATELNALISEQFLKTFEKGQDRWNYRIASKGECFE